MNENNIEIRKRRLTWQARRGLLELDCLIAPYMQKHFANINDDEVPLLEALFSMEDPDLTHLLINPEAKLSLPLPTQKYISKILQSS